MLVPQAGIEPTSPVLEGRFVTTGPPGKSYVLLIIRVSYPWQMVPPFFPADSWTQEAKVHKWQFSLIVQRPLWWAKVCKPAKPRIMGVGTAESLCGSWETMINGATYASTPSFPSHKQKPDSVKYTYCISQDVTPSLQTVSKLAFQL